MKTIIGRLQEDMRWRLSPAAKKLAPAKKERLSWGAPQIPGVAGCLAWLALSTLNYALINGLLLSGLSGGSAGIAVGLLSLPLTFGLTFVINLAMLPLIYWLGGLLQNRRDIAAYVRLLGENERFMLVEYVKYLERQARRMREAPGLGSPAEAERLLASARQIRSILAAQAGAAGSGAATAAGRDATMAESVVEAYSALVDDPIQSLDLRLTEEQRLRVADLERSMEAQDLPQRIAGRG